MLNSSSRNLLRTYERKGLVRKPPFASTFSVFLRQRREV
jgi:hypothetical protein